MHYNHTVYVRKLEAARPPPPASATAPWRAPHNAPGRDEGEGAADLRVAGPSPRDAARLRAGPAVPRAPLILPGADHSSDLWRASASALRRRRRRCSVARTVRTVARAGRGRCNHRDGGRPRGWG